MQVFADFFSFFKQKQPFSTTLFIFICVCARNLVTLHAFLNKNITHNYI